MTNKEKSAVMSAAWAIFRKSYNYPRISFASIGRKCFAWALTEAWRQAKERDAFAAIPADARAARLVVLERAREYANYTDHYPVVAAAHARIDAEIRLLQGVA